MARDPNALPRTWHKLDADEQAEIFACWQLNLSPTVIAARVNRDVSTVNRFLKTVEDRCDLAKAQFRSAAPTLATRVIEEANVAESMEVLHRIDVLPKKDEGTNGPKFQIFVGSPEHPLPLPSHEE